MKSVAIVGFSPKTFYFVKESKADEIWTLNYAFLVHNDFPRIDRLFEIHKRDWYLRKENAKNTEYDDWLKQFHGMPIYMQKDELTPEVPDGVAYPFEEICNKYLGKLLEQRGEEYVMRKYFTSSFCYMIALALYEDYDVIEIYGIDMEINTEYGYQKPCGEFWIGIALGLGKTVILQQPCTLCDALLYGYDAIPYIDPPRVKEIIEHFQNKQKGYFEEMTALAALVKQDPVNQELQDKWLKASAWYYTYEGGIASASKLMQESDTYISRQFVEIKRGQYINGMDYWKGLYNHKRGIFNQGKAKGEMDQELWGEILNARASMFANMGAMQTHLKLIRIMDMRPVSYDLKMDIAEDVDEYEKGERFAEDNLEIV